MKICPVVKCEETFARLSDLIRHLENVHGWNDSDFDAWLEPHAQKN